LRGRGFLARFLYSLPTSKVGGREIAARPVSADAENGYRNGVEALWIVPAGDEATILHLGQHADLALREFEKWLEPKLAPGETLSCLAGWANKLAGAIARIAGTLHITTLMGEGKEWRCEISAATVSRAIRLGRDYLLPHAQLAFNEMGADDKQDKA